MTGKGGETCHRIRRDGTRCKALAIKGTQYCYFHGGPMIRKNTLHGLYRKHQPPRIQELVEEHLKSPQLMNMRQHVALLSVLLAETWSNVTARIERSKAAAQTEEERKRAEEMTDPEISAIAVLAEKMTSAIEKTARIGMALKMMISLETMNEVMDVFIAQASKYIKSPTQRRKFLDDISAQATQIVQRSNVKYDQLLKISGSGSQQASSIVTQ